MEKIKKFFKVEERGSTVRTEIVAGLTTFVAMCYILIVNSGFFTELGISFGAIYIATALSAVVGTVLIGLLANLPLAQASGMGLNAFFVFTVCFGLGFTYANALLFVLADGVLFVILTATGLRKKVFEAIPKTVKTAIPAGIGLFIAFIGLQDSGIVAKDASTGVTLVSLNILGGATWKDIMPILITIVTLLAIAVLNRLHVKGAMLWSIFGGTALYFLLGLTVPDFFAEYNFNADVNPLVAFKQFGEESFLTVFTKGFDFSAYLADHSVATLVLTFATTALAFCMVDMFDTMGTLYGACKTGDMLIPAEAGEAEFVAPAEASISVAANEKVGKEVEADEELDDDEGQEYVVPNMNQAMLSDAIATCTGAICGTSTVTCFVEASSGVAAGGRTGLAAMVTAALFAVSMFLTPVAALVPAAVYAAALIYVGILMMGGVTQIDWKNPAISLPSFLTIAMMPFTYNISYGIAFGLISYVAIKVCTGRIKKISIVTWIITLLFLAMFLLSH